MKLIILGSGTSTGIPEVGCGCPCCHSTDTRDRRLRTSALVITNSGKRILIDCGPDFHEQATRLRLDGVDAVLLTHEHYDHVYGLDDLRTIAWKQTIPIYGQPEVLESIRKRMHYVFGPNPYPGTPKLSLQEIQRDQPIELFGEVIQPIEVIHGDLPILGYRIGNLTYITDMKTCTPDQWAKVDGSELLVINALRQCRPHPSHQSISDVEELLPSLALRPRLTLLTHLSHHAPLHQTMLKMLPSDIRPAYDGMMIRLEKGTITGTGSEAKAPAEPYIYEDMGRIAYAEAWQQQKHLFDSILAQKQRGEGTQSYLLFCEHNPVFTIGQHGAEANMLMSEDFLRTNGYEYYHVERGGDVTYHGPGQITGYPILDLETFGLGLRSYIELLEDSVIELLRFYGITAGRKGGATGVWLDVGTEALERKICAIGVKSSRYVTMHGFALNVNTDLAPFQLINPCGFKQGRVASIAGELGSPVDLTVTKHQLASILHRRLRERMPQPY